jgi:hypothetical protein
LVRISPIAIGLEKTSRKSLDDVTIEVVEHFITYLVTGAIPPLSQRELNELYLQGMRMPSDIEGAVGRGRGHGHRQRALGI